MDTIGARIKQARLEAGFSQQGFAKRLGLDPNNLARIEAGKSERGMKVARLVQISRLLACSVESLIPPEWEPTYDESDTAGCA